MNIAHGVTKVLKSKKFLFAIGLISTGTSVGTAIIGTLLAKRHVDEAYEEKVRKTEPVEVGDELVRPEVTLTKTEILKACWKDYVLTAASTTITVVIFTRLFTSMRNENAALHGLLSASEATIQHLQDKMVEKIGEEDAKPILLEAKNAGMEKNPPVEVPTNQALFADTAPDDIIRVCVRYDGREFKTTKMILSKGLAAINSILSKCGEATLNDFYDAIGQNESDIGNSVRWVRESVNDADIDIQWNFEWSGAYTDNDGHSWTYIVFNYEPDIIVE